MKFRVEKGGKGYKDRKLFVSTTQPDELVELCDLLKWLRFKYMNEEHIYPPTTYTDEDGDLCYSRNGLKGGYQVKEFVRLGLMHDDDNKWIHSIKECLQLTKIEVKPGRDYSDIDGKWED